MSVVERIKRLLRGDGRTVDTRDHRIDRMTSGREGQAVTQSEGGAIPPN